MTNISAGVFFYANNTQRFLYLLRTDNKNPGNWGIPGGKVEENEKEEFALERELKEELDMAVEVGDYIGRTIHPSGNVFIELIAYSCEFKTASYHLTAHDAYKFVKPSELLNYKMAPADLYFIKNCDLL